MVCGRAKVQRTPMQYLVKDCLFFLLNHWVQDHITNPKVTISCNLLRFLIMVENPLDLAFHVCKA